jgi:metal-responsive CopG/Arc/MetJ family transcriptional regulator
MIVAKVMISIPDDLLARLDSEAKRRGLSRSAFLRALTERELRVDADARREEILGILAGAGRHGGDSTEFIRAMRDSR